MSSKISAKKIKWIIIFFVVVIIIAFIYQKAYQNQKSKSGEPSGYPPHYFDNPIVDTFSAQDYEYFQTLKEEASDIEGMTKYDKYKMGLSPRDGSDSDGDGLTDKEEIEVYGSDPLKKSTSGDLYDDGYKVNHNMNLTQVYEFEGEQEFKGNSCDEIVLSATTVKDFNAVVKNITGSDSSVGGKVIAEYRIYNYSGQLSIKLGDIYDGDTSDIAVMVGIQGQDGLERYEFDVKDKVITLRDSFDGAKTYKVYVVPVDFADRLKSMFSKLDPTDSLMLLWTEKGSGLLYGSPLLGLFGEMKVTILVEDIGELTDLEKQALIDEANNYFEGDEIQSLDDKRIIVKDKASIEAKYKFFQTVIPFFEYTTDDSFGWANIIYAYKSLDNCEGFEDTIANAMKSTDNQNIVVTSGFDIDKDELRRTLACLHA